jgi:putative addiction module component (TIGR02574 family)
MVVNGSQLERMSIEDRLDLIDAVWDSLGGEPLELPIPESHRLELDRRLQDEKANPNAGEPWEKVYQRLTREP